MIPGSQLLSLNLVILHKKNLLRLLTKSSLETIDLFKCAYNSPNKTCDFKIGNFIVYDGKSRNCRIQTKGCSPITLKYFAFSSIEQCQKVCGVIADDSREPVGNFPSLFLITSEPNQQISEIPIQRTITTTTTRTTTRQGPVQIGATTTKTNPPKNLSFKCFFRTDKPSSCKKKFIGSLIVFDQSVKRCITLTQACSLDEVDYISFPNFTDCNKTCLV